MKECNTTNSVKKAERSEVPRAVKETIEVNLELVRLAQKQSRLEKKMAS